MTERPPAIVLIGATGYTGRLVAHALARDDAPFVLAARDPERLDAVAEETGGPPTATVDVTDPASLAALIRRGDAVINTAGPFDLLGDPVIRACIDAGAHYLDTTGEQRFMRETYERHHAAATDAGVSVVNAMAFEYALGDCAVALAAREAAPFATLDIVYAWGGAASSRGTRATALRILGRRAWVRRDGSYRRQAPGARRRTVTLATGPTLHAVSFGAGEVVTAPRHVEVDTARGWAVVGAGAARVAPVLSPILPFLVRLLRPLLARLAARKPDPTPEERADSDFTVRIEAAPAEPSSEMGPTGPVAVEVQGTDPYGLTATIAVRGAVRAMEPDAPRGVLAPAELVDARAFLAALEPRVKVLVGREG